MATSGKQQEQHATTASINYTLNSSTQDLPAST